MRVSAEAEGRAHTREGRLALRTPEAAAALGVSRDHFERHIAPELACVYVGRVRLYAVAAIEAWLEGKAVAPVHQTGGRGPSRMGSGVQ